MRYSFILTPKLPDWKKDCLVLMLDGWLLYDMVRWLRFYCADWFLRLDWLLFVFLDEKVIGLVEKES